MEKKYRVLKDYETLKVGDIVTLKENKYNDSYSRAYKK